MKDFKKQKGQPFKIALYIRVSTEEQAENPEGSIRNQEDRLRHAVEYKNRIGSFGEIQGVYIDAGISAKDMKRPKLQELLRAIRSREVDLVMVTELSRLSRNTRDFIEMWDMMRDHACGFTSLREDFDTTTAAGEMVLFQLMNLAQFERKQTSERVEAGIAARAARGLYNGGMVPLGYRIIEERPGYLELDPGMARVVHAAFTSFLHEGTLSKTAKWLNENGYKLKRSTQGGGSKARLGHFTVDNLQALLRNKTYLGIKSYRHRGEIKEVRAVWPAIVSEAVFHRVGQVLDQNRRRLKPESSRKLPYVLSGLCHCVTCRSAMSGKSATGNGGKVGYYEHVWATKRDATLTKKSFKCAPHRVPAKKLEPLVLEKVQTLLTDPRFMRELLKRVEAHHRENPRRKDEERLKAKLFGINSQIEALAERLAELPKTVSAQPIYRQMAKLELVKQEHEGSLMRLKANGQTSLSRLVGLSSFQEFSSHYREFLKTAGPDQTKMILQKFIRKIEVGTESVKIHWIVDKDHYRRESQLTAAGPAPSGAHRLESHFSEKSGSNTLTVGAPGRT